MSDLTYDQRDTLKRLMRFPGSTIPADVLALFVAEGFVEQDGSRLTYKGQFEALRKVRPGAASASQPRR